MKKIQHYGTFITIILFLFLLSAGCTLGQTGTPAGSSGTTTTFAVTPASHQATREEMVAFVQEAVSYAKVNGRENALVEFSNPKGSFFRGSLYIYAYDYNGTTIAHPVNPEKIGVNRLEEKDADGKYFIRELMDASNDGTGFVMYTYINPTANNRVDRKLGYVMKVDDDWWLGSGIYLGPAETPTPEAADLLPDGSAAVTPTGK